MSDKPTRLSIGLPIFNGEDYLEEALNSLLAQTYTDFELIISDNASTDGTQEICQTYAARDGRIRYHRNQENIGASQNWYRVFNLSSSEYFVFAADDDLYAPEFMQECVAVLDQNPSVIVCYSKTKFIDAHGKVIRNIDVEIDTISPKPHVRLFNMIGVEYWCIQMYGVMRASALRKTQVYTGYFGWDRNTLAELSLWGQVYEVPDYLFFHRLHPRALGAAKSSGKSLTELSIHDPTINWRFVDLAFLTKFRNYFVAVTRVPLSHSDRLMCYVQLVRLFAEQTTNQIKRRWQHRRVR